MTRYMLTALILTACIASAQAQAQSWNTAKNQADDVVYAGVTATFYCGCQYRSHGDSDGSGDILSTATCGYQGPETHAHRADRIEWEHIVPASLMPARQFECWTEHGRNHCERHDPVAQAMLLDLHNLAPSIGQVNALRSNDRYGDLPDQTSDFGSCPIEDARGVFEPPPCVRGDVARVWFHMAHTYGVEIASAEMAMFEAWSQTDPVSPWESEREARIFELTGVPNAFVYDVVPNPAGACDWEPR